MEDQQKDMNTVDNVGGINIPPVSTTTSDDDKDQIIASLTTVKQSNITPASDVENNIETSEAPIEETSSNSNDEADNDSVSSDITDVAIANIEEQNQFDEDINAAPMHLHALRIKDARLKGLPRHNSDGKLLDSSDKHCGRRSRSTSRSRPGGGSMRSVASSRSSSPLPSTGGGSRYTSDVQHAASDVRDAVHRIGPGG